MNKIKAIITACLMIGLASMTFAPSAFGSDSEGINVTLTPNATANITLNQTTWHPGCGIDEINETNTDWGTCTNDGSVRCNVTINITEDTGTVWEVLDAYQADPGNDNVCFGFYDIGTTSWKDLYETPVDFGTIAYGSSQTFGLNVTMPSSTSTNADQNFTITFTATAYGN